MLDRAKAAEDDELALKAIARAEKQLELQAKLLGQIKEGADRQRHAVAWSGCRSAR